MSNGGRAVDRRAEGPRRRAAVSRAISLDRLPGRARSKARSPSRRDVSRWAGPQLVQALDERVADIGAGRPAEAAMRLRLEGQQGEHMVEHRRASCARGRSATPRPRARRSRRSAMTGRRRRTRLADGMGEIRAVDGDQKIRRMRRRWRRSSARPARRSSGSARRRRRSPSRRCRRGETGSPSPPPSSPGRRCRGMPRRAPPRRSARISR